MILICPVCKKEFYHGGAFNHHFIKCNQKEKVVTDNINPDHYKQGGIETFDYIKAKMTTEQLEGYLMGNILKYVSRYKHKNGEEDLKKAEWYLKELIKLLD